MKNCIINKNITRSVIVKLQYEATHNWPDCNISYVQYLSNEHRHIFYFTCTKSVEHSNRAIEIITFKNEILNFLQERYDHKFLNMSCEMLAEELCAVFKLDSCTVLEDNENGASVTIDWEL